MLRQKQAPVARTPPVLPQIPGITKNETMESSKKNRKKMDQEISKLLLNK